MRISPLPGLVNSFFQKKVQGGNRFFRNPPSRRPGAALGVAPSAHSAQVLPSSVRILRQEKGGSAGGIIPRGSASGRGGPPNPRAGGGRSRAGRPEVTRLLAQAGQLLGGLPGPVPVSPQAGGL